MHRATVLAFPLLAFSLTLAAIAQDPREQPADAIALVAQGERLCGAGQIEDAALVLWRALDLLASQPNHALCFATMLSARHLLDKHDPREKERRRVFASIAKQQVELAKAYRSKKWFDVAATRLEVAAHYDRDEVGKELALLEAAPPKPKVVSPPPAEPAPAKVRPSPLLQRENTVVAFGNWHEKEDRLECESHPGSKGHLKEWITNEDHGEHELVVEFRPEAATKEHNCALGFGLAVLQGTTHFSGYRAHCQYHPESGEHSLLLWSLAGDKVDQLGSVSVVATNVHGGFHRLAVQVRSTSLALYLDEHPPLTVAVPKAPAGKVGLFVGVTSAPSCAVQFRNLRKDPLPIDRPTDEQVRQQVEAEHQNAIVAAVESAKDLLAKKQPEAASLLLREAMGNVGNLPNGVLRDNLGASIEKTLAQADPMALRRKKMAQDIATELVALADQYAQAGMARQALVLAEHAASFDAGKAERLATAREAVRAWNAAQMTARANELMPPADDGAVQREWFTNGRLLDSRFQPWLVNAASARVAALEPGSVSVLLPKAGSAPLTKASVHVRLVRAGAAAGFCFDAAGSNDYAVAFLERRARGLALLAYRYHLGKWTMLATKMIPIDDWRLEGWFQIAIEANAAGITVRAQGAEIVFDRKRLGAAVGHFGLYAGSADAQPLAVELRGFQVPK